jgi:DNA-binding LacI/PurR family transcriptional regulator
VAEAADVSISAVSRAFTVGASVAPKKRAHIRQIAEGLGYMPNAFASSLTTQRSFLIAIISTNFRNPYFMEIFHRFTLKLQERNLRPLIVNLSEDLKYEQAILMLRQYRVDGVIVASSTLDPEFYVELEKLDVPSVVAFGRTRGKAPFGTAMCDNEEGGAIAAEAMARHGYRKVGFLGGPQFATTTIDRRRGFLETARKLGLKIGEKFADRYSHEDGFATAEKMLEEWPLLEALFCGDDILAMGACDFVRSRLGRRIPEDIGILGFNDMSMARWPAYDLTTIRQPVESIVDNAIELVCGQIAAPEMETQMRVFRCELIERGTLRSLPD